MDLRPTADRLRETLFDVLTAGNPSALEGTVWLDLFAGTGAVGIEALSRGAGMVYFVEKSARAVELIRKNLESLGVEEGYRVMKQDVNKALPGLAEERITADFIFLDPPYQMKEAYGQTLESLGEAQLAKTGGLVIAEHQKKFDPGEAFSALHRFRKLEQGDAALSFYKKI
jgi:16S rRNA (guanine(966)-N(2))-methyltransferase RsmD